MRALQNSLGYEFGDLALLERALTHPSYAAEHGGSDYQRLEFLGDAVLQLVVSDLLFRRYGQIAEGRLTRARAALVREESLFAAAEQFELGRSVRLSVGEEKTGGRRKPSILADVMEAVIAAVYLDGGLAPAHALVEKALAGPLSGDPEAGALDAKSELQMVTQRECGLTPTYELAAQSGEAHRPVFTIRVLLGGVVLAQADGASKQAAAQSAARRALASYPGPKSSGKAVSNDCD